MVEAKEKIFKLGSRYQVISLHLIIIFIQGDQTNWKRGLWYSLRMYG